MKDHTSSFERPGKFEDPFVTASGSARATVALTHARTLWFNTGTLCNITCENCYIESSPTNDRLAYITAADVDGFLAQIVDRGWPTREIGLTGGEPFMNPEIIGISDLCLGAGYDLLILTNAMRPMMRGRVKEGLLALNARHPGKLTLRVSLDHYTAEHHDALRGAASFETTLKGMRWLRDNGVPMAVAGRTIWGEDETQTRNGFAAFFNRNGFDIDATDPVQTVLFPEIDETVPVPEITTECWNILGKSPDDVMCASSRMVVKRRGEDRPVVLACTLLPYDPEFELGRTLAEAETPVALNHPNCAKFCVLGGASCSA